MADSGNKSPSIRSSEVIQTGLSSRNLSSVTAVVVRSEKGPVNEATFITSLDEYDSIFGSGSNQVHRIDRSIAAGLLAGGYALSVVRAVDALSTVYASTENPSDEQIAEITVTGDSLVIEGKEAQFTVTVVFQGGQTLDVTRDTSISYALQDPSFGTVANGIFFSSSKLGSAIININYQGNTLVHVIDVVQLEVQSLQLIGPSSLIHNQESQFRAIAYFIDDTAKDVTFDDETSWIAETGNFNSYENGYISGTTISIDTVNQVRVVHRNASQLFSITISPTPFDLISAGDAVFEIGTFSADLNPEYIGDINSHTVSWEITLGTNANIINPNSLTNADFVMLANPSNFYEIRLYIDKNTVNEQTDSLLISRSAYSPFVSEMFVMWGFRDVMDSQGRVDQAGSLTEVRDYILGPNELSIKGEMELEPFLFSVWNQDEEMFDLNWGFTGTPGILRIISVEIQEAVSNAWVVNEVFTDDTSSKLVPSGKYRIRVTYEESSLNRSWKFSQPFRVTHSGIEELDSNDAFSKMVSTVPSSLTSKASQGDQSNLLIQVTKLINLQLPVTEGDTAFSSDLAVKSTSYDFGNRIIDLKRLVTYPETLESEYTTQLKVVTNCIIDEGDFSNWDVTLLTAT